MTRSSPKPREPYELRGTKRNLVSDFKPGAKSTAESPTTDGLHSPSKRSKKERMKPVTPTTVATASSGKASLASSGKDDSPKDNEVSSATKAFATAALAEYDKIKAKLAAIEKAKAALTETPGSAKGNAKEASAKTPGSANKKTTPNSKKKTPDSKKKKRKSPYSSTRKRRGRSLPTQSKKKPTLESPAISSKPTLPVVDAAPTQVTLSARDVPGNEGEEVQNNDVVEDDVSSIASNSSESFDLPPVAPAVLSARILRVSRWHTTDPPSWWEIHIEIIRVASMALKRPEWEVALPNPHKWALKFDLDRNPTLPTFKITGSNTLAGTQTEMFQKEYNKVMKQNERLCGVKDRVATWEELLSGWSTIVRFFSLFWCIRYKKSKRDVYTSACEFGQIHIKLKKDFTNTIKKLLESELRSHWVKKMIAIADQRVQVGSSFVYHDDEYVNHILHEFLEYKKIPVKADACKSTEFKAWLKTASDANKVALGVLGETYSMDELKRMLNSVQEQKKKAEEDLPVEPAKPEDGSDEDTDEGTVEDGEEKTNDDTDDADSTESADGDDDISDDDNDVGVPLDNDDSKSSPKPPLKMEKKAKERGDKVSTPETASTKGSDETATATPAKGSSKKSTKDNKPGVVTETITASHGIVSNVIPGLIDTSNQTPLPIAGKSFGKSKEWMLSDDWRCPTYDLSTGELVSQPGVTWRDNALRSYVVMMNFVNKVHSYGLLSDSFFYLRENELSHGITSTKFTDQRACLMLIAMGIHDVQKMGSSKSAIFKAIDVWMLRLFSDNAIRYLQGCFQIMTAGSLWNNDARIENGVALPVKYCTPLTLDGVIREVIFSHTACDQIWLTRLQQVCRGLAKRYGDQPHLIEIKDYSNLTGDNDSVEPLKAIALEVATAILHQNATPGTHASTILSDFFELTSPTGEPLVGSPKKLFTGTKGSRPDTSTEFTRHEGVVIRSKFGDDYYKKLNHYFFEVKLKDLPEHSRIGPDDWKEYSCVSYRGFKTMSPGVWFSDEPLDLSMALIHGMQKDPKEFEVYPTCFMQQLLVVQNPFKVRGKPKVKIDYKAVDNYSYSHWGEEYVFGCKKLAIPINMNDNHWVLVVVCFETKTIHYYDSNKNTDDRFCRAVKMYLEAEWKAAKKEGKMDTEKHKWQLIKSSPREDPQQPNQHDCGVFVCCKLEHLALSRKMPRTIEESFERRMELAVRILKHCEAAEEEAKKAKLEKNGTPLRRSKRKRPVEETKESGQTEKANEGTPVAKDGGTSKTSPSSITSKIIGLFKRN